MSTNMVHQNPRTDGLTQLLSRLPMELRLQIYRLSLPLLRHRNRRVDVAFLSDISWSASSQPLFDEVGSLVLRESIVVFHTGLSKCDNLVKDFDLALDRAFSGQALWAPTRAHPTLARIKIIIRFPLLYSTDSILPERLEQYLSGLNHLLDPKSVQISLAPEQLSEWHHPLTGPFRIDAIQKSPYHFAFLDGLRRELAAVHDCFSAGCHVYWRFGRAGMPEYQSTSLKSAEAVMYLEMLNEYVEGLLARRRDHAVMATELAETCWRKSGVFAR